MKPNIVRIKENKYYILYKRIKDRGDSIPLYVIYYTDEFGGGISEQFSTRQQSLRFFAKATKEAIEYNRGFIDSFTN
jgi:hypothetical protein